jgi:hypothetical protein
VSFVKLVRVYDSSKRKEYVDDNNITNNGRDGETVKDGIKRTQHDAQLWNDLLRATGGALNMDKCFTQVLAYTFALNGGPVIAPANPYTRHIFLRLPSGQQ